MSRIRVIAVVVPTECAVCERPIQPGRTWCSWVCRNADDQHDTYDTYEGDDDAA